MPTVKITHIENKGDKVAMVDYTVGDKQGQARAWRTESDKWKVGDEMTVEFEKRKGYREGDPDEAWFKSTIKGRGGFGGGGGGKPQKTPEENWSIVAQTCIKCASDIQIALINADPAQAKNFDINKVCGWADDLYDQARQKVAGTTGGK